MEEIYKRREKYIDKKIIREFFVTKIYPNPTTLRSGHPTTFLNGLETTTRTRAHRQCPQEILVLETDNNMQQRKTRNREIKEYILETLNL